VTPKSKLEAELRTGEALKYWAVAESIATDASEEGIDAEEGWEKKEEAEE